MEPLVDQRHVQRAGGQWADDLAGRRACSCPMGWCHVAESV